MSCIPFPVFSHVTLCPGPATCFCLRRETKFGSCDIKRCCRFYIVLVIWSARACSALLLLPGTVAVFWLPAFLPTQWTMMQKSSRKKIQTKLVRLFSCSHVCACVCVYACFFCVGWVVDLIIGRLSSTKALHFFFSLSLYQSQCVCQMHATQNWGSNCSFGVIFFKTASVYNVCVLLISLAREQSERVLALCAACSFLFFSAFCCFSSRAYWSVLSKKLGILASGAFGEK